MCYQFPGENHKPIGHCVPESFERQWQEESIATGTRSDYSENFGELKSNMRLNHQAIKKMI